MRKDIKYIILVVAASGAMLAAAPFDAAEERSPEEAPVTIGAEADYPPYSFFDEKGEPAGYSIELTRAVAKAAGLNVKIVMGPWSEMLRDLEAGKIDAIAGMYYSEKRAGNFDFSAPYAIGSHMIFARRDSPVIVSEDELRGRDIIVVADDITHNYVLQKGLSKNPVLAESQSSALRLLASGKHDFAIVFELAGLYWARRPELSNLITMGPPILPSKCCYAVARGNAGLLNRINDGMGIISLSGEGGKLRDKWLGALKPVRFSRALALRYAAMVLIPVFLAGLILWSLTLRAQVARRTRELRLANDKLRQLDQMKSNFVSHVSHEFKNPLFTIQDAIGIVLNGEVGGINEKQKQMLEFAKKNADRMLRLVTDLLDLSRIEAGKMQLRKERIDMAPFLEEAMAGREMDVSKKGLTLRKDISCEAGAVTGDRDKLTQVIVNLLSNAIKYTPSGGTITVRATGDEDEARLEVSDTGPGIAKEDIDRLFDKFERITAENQEGTGLGLAISRDIINLHKGKIWVESEPGKGARFIITLPRG